MFFGPMLASQLAVYTTLRLSQTICGIIMLVTLVPAVYKLLPETHSIPKLATARLRPQVSYSDSSSVTATMLLFSFTFRIICQW